MSVDRDIADAAAAWRPADGRLFQRGYSGETRDRNELFFYGFRSYDPSIARWTSPDPAGIQGGRNYLLNLYLMVDSNPATHRDHRGLSISRDGVIALFRQQTYNPEGRGVPTAVTQLISAMVGDQLSFVWRIPVPRAPVHGVLTDEVNFEFVRESLRVTPSAYRGKSWGGRGIGSYHLSLLRSLFGQSDTDMRLPSKIEEYVLHYLAEEVVLNGPKYLINRHSSDNLRDVSPVSSSVLFDAVMLYEMHGRKYGVLNYVAELSAFVYGQLLNRFGFRRESVTKNAFSKASEYYLARADDMIKLLSYSNALKTSGLLFNTDELTQAFNRDPGRTKKYSPKTAWRDTHRALRQSRPEYQGFLQRQLVDLNLMSRRAAMVYSHTFFNALDAQLLKTVTSRDNPRGERIVDFARLHAFDSRFLGGILAKRSRRRKKTKKNQRNHISNIKHQQTALRARNETNRLLRSRPDITRLPPQLVPPFEDYSLYLVQFMAQQKRAHAPVEKIKQSVRAAQSIVFLKKTGYKFGRPIYYEKLQLRDIAYIQSNMHPYVWVSLSLGATGRHHDKIDKPHHQHLMPKKGAFSFAYEDLGGGFARAVIYSFVKGVVGPDKNTKYLWPGQKFGTKTAAEVPSDLVPRLVGYRAPQSQKPPVNKKSKQKKRFQKNHNKYN